MLDLSFNHPGKSGLKLLSAKVEDPSCKLKTLKTAHCAEIRLTPGVRKYACELTLDPNTAHRQLFLSEGYRKVTALGEKLSYPDHPKRFDSRPQVLCTKCLLGRFYWEVEWSGKGAGIAVACKSIKRKGDGDDTRVGRNDKSWYLHCSPDSCYAWYNNIETFLPAPSVPSRRVGVYLDWWAGTLSFYSVSSDTLTHLHTFHSKFTESLYPGFWVWSHDSSVSLCQITSTPNPTNTYIRDMSEDACELTLDISTAYRYLSISKEKKKVKYLRERQSYPYCRKRFSLSCQVLCNESLSTRCYWEAEWSGSGAGIAVAFEGIDRRSCFASNHLGHNDKSWSLECSHRRYSAWHNNKRIDIPAPSSGSRRVGVYLDWLAGTLSFYSVSPETVSHLHTFHHKFTEPLYPGFRFWSYESSVSLR